MPTRALPSRSGHLACARPAAVVLAAAVALLGCSGGDDTSTTTTTDGSTTTQLSQRYTIAELLPLDTQFAPFLALLEELDLLDELDGEEPVTAFVPSVEAWEDAEDVLAGLSEDEQRALLRRHLVEGALTRRDLAEVDGGQVTTIDGEELAVEVDGTAVSIGGVPVIKRDIVAGNGVVHVIGQVLRSATTDPDAGEEDAGEDGSGEADGEPLDPEDESDGG